MDGKTRELIEKAIEEIKRGNNDEAALILERTLRPKFWSSSRSNLEYIKAMSGA